MRAVCRVAAARSSRWQRPTTTGSPSWATRDGNRTLNSAANCGDNRSRAACVRSSAAAAGGPRVAPRPADETAEGTPSDGAEAGGGSAGAGGAVWRGRSRRDQVRNNITGPACVLRLRHPPARLRRAPDATGCAARQTAPATRSHPSDHRKAYTAPVWPPVSGADTATAPR